MKKLNDYVRSLPVRIVAAVIVLLIMLALGKFEAKEEPAPPQPGQQGGLLDAHQESTETVLRVMNARPPDK